jgi:hypothetical protein
VSEATVLLGAMLSPLLAFALLMWLTHLEETLPHDVAAAQRKPPPPPILAIVEPAPQRAPAAEPRVAPAVSNATAVVPALTSTDLPEGGSALAV